MTDWRSDPGWYVARRGHTTRGNPWVLVHLASGRQVRVTIPAALATPEGERDCIDAAILGLRRLPPART